MQDLKKHERFELEVLEKLNSIRVLNQLIFIGGTMLRLCYGLNRFSVDLDFWLAGDADKKKLYRQIRAELAGFYKLRDSADKFHTMLFEIKSPDYPRSLKIEIRKEPKLIKTAHSIAYSPYADRQGYVRTAAPEEMMRAKIAALLNRKEIRDAFDIEFLIKRGIKPAASPAEAEKILRVIESFTKKDYTVKLGSLLEPADRGYYSAENFKIIKSALADKGK